LKAHGARAEKEVFVGFPSFLLHYDLSYFHYLCISISLKNVFIYRLQKGERYKGEYINQHATSEQSMLLLEREREKV
jgi:hypothetical protein